MENNTPVIDTRQEYRKAVSQMGKKEYTLLKMQEYGFWPSNLPTPYEKQKNESSEDFQKRKDLLQEQESIAGQIADLYREKSEISAQLAALRKQYNETWDYDAIRKDVAQKIMQESIARRKERKEQRALEKQRISAAWKKTKAERIVFIGKGYSGGLSDLTQDEERLTAAGLPIIADDKALAALLELEYQELRLLAYHRDVVITDHYSRYTIPKRNGKERHIAAPKPLLKKAQKNILEMILEKVEISDHAHGFVKGKSVISGAASHKSRPALLINIDIKDFFPSITFERVRGMFKAFGYSGYIASLLAMLCTYCERMPMEIKDQIKYVKTSGRILPQGSPASPMITNILCRKLDRRLLSFAARHSFDYSRYADDMSFSFANSPDPDELKKVLYGIQCIVTEEGFEINKKKTRYLRKNNRQCITGIVINNEQIGVPKIWLKRMRAAVYNANKRKAEGQLTAHHVNELSGMASWLKSVNYERYQKIVDEALNIVNDYKNG